MKNTTLLSLIVGSVSTIALADDTDPFLACFQDYIDFSHSCSDTFNDPENDDYYDQDAYEACLDGARLALESCLDGDARDHRDAFEFLIKQCIRNFRDDPAAFESCLEAALETYRALLGLPPSNSCGLQLVGTDRVAENNNIASSSILLGGTSGMYPAQVGSTVSFTTGNNTTLSYDVSNITCIKHAEMIAIYETETGPKTLTFDADLDTSDGTASIFPVFASEMVHADRVIIVSLYYNASFDPVFAEYGFLEIEPSAIPGDWNRDNIKNNDDVTDFTASFNAEVGRADLNTDGIFDLNDISIFIAEYSTP